MTRRLHLLAMSLLLLPIALNALFSPVTFPSQDGLIVRADLYTITPFQTERPLILLFHQAGWSRGEYQETAPKLNALGFNCLAVDLRSGQEVNGVVNETAVQARKEGKRTGYTNAWQDIEAAVAFVRKEFKAKNLVLMGSSYSASLVLRYAAVNPEGIDALVSFSPGEYFSREGMDPNWIQHAVKALRVPVWIGSAADEHPLWKDIFSAIPDSTAKSFYLPPFGGEHGSRALWEKFPDNSGYWSSLEIFLKRFVR